MAVKASKVKIAGEDKKTSRFVDAQLPSHIVNSEGLLTNFMEAYYEWMEKEGNPVGDSKRLPEYMHEDKTPEKFLEYFMGEFLPGVPSEIASDKRLLLRHGRELYSAKGSEKSFKLLFRILYDEDVDVIYPKNNLLRASAGKWVKDILIRTESTDENILDFESRKIYGRSSGASAIVEQVNQFFSGADLITELNVSNLVGLFDPDEVIETRDAPETGLVKVEARVHGIVGSYTIGSGGSGYVEGSIIGTTGGDGRDFSAKISSVDSNGAIQSIQIINPGVGYYTNAPTFDDSGMTGSGASITFTPTGQLVSDGRFADNSGKLSSTPVIQDGRTYQEYSYILRSSVPIDDWLKDVKRIAHPAGMFVSGEFEDYATPSDLTNPYMMFHTSQPDGFNYNDPNHPSSRLFFEPELILETVFTQNLSEPSEDLVVRRPDGNFEVNLRSISTHSMLSNEELEPYIMNFYRTFIEEYDDTAIEDIEWKRTSYPQTFGSRYMRTATYVTDYWEDDYTSDLLYVQ